jgi:putative peptidoglycan lipid II flippase
VLPSYNPNPLRLRWVEMNLLKAASTVSVLTLASRITGLARDTIIAAAFGAGAATDAFNVAFRIPNLLRRLFAEGAFSQAFVPTLAATRESEGDEATRALIDAVATVLFWVLLLTCAVGVVAAPLLVWMLGSGLKDFDDAVVMTRWMFPYIGFMSLVALSAGVLNTWKHFMVPAATPVLLNLAVIAAAWLLAPQLERMGIKPIYALAVGVLIGGVLQLLIQIPALKRVGVLPRVGMSVARWKTAWQHPGVTRVLRQMAPALLGVSVAQISLLINTQLASHQGVGAVSWLFYADRLMEFPTGLLGVALGVVLLPQLTAAQARKDDTRYTDLLDWGLRLVLLLALPCVAALVVFPQPMIATLFHRGAFGAEDVAKTVMALRGYGVGLLGIIAVKVLAPGFYARQDIRTPVRIAVAVLVMTQLMNLVFVPMFGHAGLALSIGLGATVNAVWLYVGLRRQGVYRPLPGWAAFLARIVTATTAMALWLGWMAAKFDWIGLQSNGWLRIGWLATTLVVAALIYFGVLAVLGVRVGQFVRRA